MARKLTDDNVINSDDCTAENRTSLLPIEEKLFFFWMTVTVIPKLHRFSS